MYRIDEMRQLKVLAVCEASLNIIKQIEEGKTITKEQKFAITDSHKEMFNYTSDLIQENKNLKKKLSEIRHCLGKLALEYKQILFEEE